MPRYYPSLATTHAPLPTSPCPAAYHAMPRCLPPHATLTTTVVPSGQGRGRTAEGSRRRRQGRSCYPRRQRAEARARVRRGQGARGRWRDLRRLRAEDLRQEIEPGGAALLQRRGPRCGPRGRWRVGIQFESGAAAERQDAPRQTRGPRSGKAHSRLKGNACLEMSRDSIIVSCL